VGEDPNKPIFRELRHKHNPSISKKVGNVVENAKRWNTMNQNPPNNEEYMNEDTHEPP